MGTIRLINTSELTPHWDKILFGIELSLIGILFRQLPQNRKLWQHSRVSWSTRSASLSPPPPAWYSTMEGCWSINSKSKSSALPPSYMCDWAVRTDKAGRQDWESNYQHYIDIGQISFFFFLKIWYLAEKKREKIAFPKYPLLGEM